MRNIYKIFLSLTFALLAVGTFAQTFPAKPNPPRLVNDFTNTLTSDQREALEQKLVMLDDSTSTQVAVVIIDKLDGAGISDYNQGLGRAWGVGGAKNNGVLLLIAKSDHKLDIAVGNGLEGALTDATAQQIIDGIDQGTDAIVQAVRGQFNAPRATRSTGRSGGGKLIFYIIVIIIIMLLSNRNKGGGGSYMSRRGGTGLAQGLFWSSLLGGGGSGGGWSGGGGGSSGGFGGFGGGSFGGGGASGSW